MPAAQYLLSLREEVRSVESIPFAEQRMTAINQICEKLQSCPREDHRDLLVVVVGNQQDMAAAAGEDSVARLRSLRRAIEHILDSIALPKFRSSPFFSRFLQWKVRFLVASGFTFLLNHAQMLEQRPLDDEQFR